MGYNRVHIDTKEVDAENEEIIKGMRIRIVSGKRIITLALKIPLNYPEEPVQFSHGNL